jgi:hypothetical protein
MKLDDIKKKNIYTVPDKYFDQLPTRIQSRVNEEQPVSRWRWNQSLIYKLAAPAFVVVLLLFYFGLDNKKETQDFETILAQVSNEDIIAYLGNTDITTEEIIEAIDFSDAELDFYEDGPIMRGLEDIGEEDLNTLFDEYGLDEEIL